jgi:hypothetical protein
MRVACILIVFACVGASPARAQQNRAEVEAEELFVQGRELLKQGRSDEACARFEASHRLDPAPGTLLNLALCNEKRGKVASAWALYREVEDLARREGQEKRAATARERARVLEAELPRLIIEVAAQGRVPGLIIERDGSALNTALLWQAAYVDPGVHRIVARAPGYEEWIGEIRIKKGEQATMAIPVLQPEEKQATVAIPLPEREEKQASVAIPVQEVEPGVREVRVREVSVATPVLEREEKQASVANPVLEREESEQAASRRDAVEDVQAPDAKVAAGPGDDGGAAGTSAVKDVRAPGLNAKVAAGPGDDGGATGKPGRKRRMVGLDVGGAGARLTRRPESTREEYEPSESAPSGSYWGLVLQGGMLVLLGSMSDVYRSSLAGSGRLGWTSRTGLGLDLAAEYAPLSRVPNQIGDTYEIHYVTASVMPRFTLGKGALRLWLAVGGGLAYEHSTHVTAFEGTSLGSTSELALSGTGAVGLELHPFSSVGLAVISSYTRTHGSFAYQFVNLTGGLVFTF